MSTTEMNSQTTDPLLLGDHPALDLLNTEALVEGRPVDFWTSDADVLRWLARCGFATAQATQGDMTGFLDKARELRAVARELIVLRKAGKHGDAARLNGFLAALNTHPRLVWDGPDDVRLIRCPAGQTADQLLAALAEAVATLLAEGDFKLVRQCDHAECMLWFYDRTKGHRRRWCSMSLCGNRHKVEQFRKRSVQAQR